mmetsp:Transcript_66658/g.144774  ORF Transcript_66658/g.144774 Transcript_66658/m.144774 type:complete len:189 (+) Transcript_66658:1894-2460(+)
MEDRLPHHVDVGSEKQIREAERSSVAPHCLQNNVLVPSQFKRGMHQREAIGSDAVHHEAAVGFHGGGGELKVSAGVLERAVVTFGDEESATRAHLRLEVPESGARGAGHQQEQRDRGGRFRQWSGFNPARMLESTRKEDPGGEEKDGGIYVIYVTLTVCKRAKCCNSARMRLMGARLITREAVSTLES